MKIYSSLKVNENKVGTLYEIPASFLFVILNFFLVRKIDGGNGMNGLLYSSAVFALIYFAETRIFSLKAKVHILPIISFIESSSRENATVFFSRLAGQLAGAVLAFLIIWLTHDKENISFHTFQFVPIHPLFTILFMGFTSQVIYFVYLFLIVKSTTHTAFWRHVLLSVALGFIFFVISLIGNISLLNPFGILFSFFYSGQPLTIETLLIGSFIHILVPILFIGGTHLFMKGFILK